MKKKLASVMMVLFMLLNTLVTGSGVAYAEEQTGDVPLKATTSFNAPDGGKIDDDVTRSGLLGIAKHFHIFANKATLKADTAGNVAVGNLDAQSNFGTKIKDGKLKLDISYIQNAKFIQSSSFENSNGNRKNKAVFGENVQLTLVDNGNKVAANGNKLDHLNKDEIFQDKNGNQYINFAEEFKKLKNSSDEIATHPQTPSVEKNFNDENNRYFDVSKVKTTASGTVILTKTDEDGKLLDNVVFDLYKEGNNSPIKSGLKTKNGKITVTDLEKGNYYFKEVATIEGYDVDSSEQKFSIKDENLGSGSTIYLDLTKEEIEKDRPIIIKGIDKNGSNIIVNVDTKNAQTINIGAEIKLQYTDGTDRSNHETEDFSDAVVLWNFKNRASNQVININRARFQGSILAVGNTVEVGQNVDGCIIADTVNITGGESHRWDFQEKNGNNGKPAELTMVNKLKEVPTKVKFSKKALTEDGEELKGAKIKLTKEDGSLVKEWVTDGSVTEFELKDGKYTFTEVSAPDKYQAATAITFEVKDGKVFVKNVEVSGNTIVMVDKLKEVPTKVKFSKKALTENGEELKGAKIKLTKEDGSLVKEWVTDGSVTEFELKDGKYTFTEVSAPDKYQAATAITFEVKDGKVFVKNVEVSGNTIVMVDKLKEVPTKVKFSKKALTENGEELKGAKIKLTKEDGSLVKEWVTDGSVTEFELKDGKYTFTEVSAPDKYQAATAITFEVKDGKVFVKNVEVSGNTIVMVDKLKEVPTKVKFSKKALTENGEELKGAKIKLTKEDGSLVKEWVTDGSVTEFKLKDGKYTFTEVSAPDKYQAATAITFEVKDGKVFVKNVEVSGNTIVMVDKLKEVPTKVKFSKKALTENGEELKGAKIKLTKEDGSLVKEWVTDGSVTEFELKDGKYTFTEVSAPDKYQAATAITFEVKDGKVFVKNVEVSGNTIVMVDKLKEVPTKVKFSKKALTENGEELKGAKIKLTKEDGSLVKEWVTDGSVTEFELKDGKYTFTEVSAPDKYQAATAITFEVKDGKVFVKNVEVSGNTIVMVDKLKEVPTKPEIKKPKTPLPKTGDSSNLSLYVLGLGLSGLGLLLLGIFRRKKAEEN